jgi:hypothetical protein
MYEGVSCRRRTLGQAFDLSRLSDQEAFPIKPSHNRASVSCRCISPAFFGLQAFAPASTFAFARECHATR